MSIKDKEGRITSTQPDKETYNTKQNTSSRKNLLLIFIGVLLVVGFLFGVIVIGRSIDQHAASDPYCESWDFGGGGCSVDVLIYNDTKTAYTLKQCSGSFRTPQCKAFSEVFTLVPGATSQSVIGTAEKYPPQPWLVADQRGNTAGCLNLQFTKDALQRQPVTIDLSKLTTCKEFL
jgi:hypothetical protein